MLPMKNAILAILLGLLCSRASAHMNWLAPGEGGFKLFYGDLTEDVVEKGEEKLKRFEAFTGVDSSKKESKAEMREDHLFFAGKAGDFKIDNLNSEVREPKPGSIAYDGQVAVPNKSFQYLRYLADPTKKGKPSKGQAIDAVPTGKDRGFQVLKQGGPAKHMEIQLIAPNGWVRPLYPDKEGLVKAITPWPGLYILKVSWKDRSGGEFNGKKYQLASHTLTLSFQSR
jgi:hypothetical protein